MAERVTVSFSAETLSRARAAAHREGLSLSAWLERAARREALRDAVRRQDEWLRANPDVRAELDGFDRFVDRFEAGWSDHLDVA
ncbi:MAG TPA: hypothetical protein VF174_05300 [Micromonosporaceae bacterium]